MASTSISISIMIFIFLLSPHLFVEIEAKILGKHELNIYCEVPANSSSVIAHCGSKDDDFGSRELYPSEYFGWRFRTNLIRSTLYFCHFWWGSKNKSLVVFQGDWDSDYYYMYSYVINKYGVYLSNDRNNHSANLGLVSTWD
ncbi:hypothetical protein PHJA_001429400 [Phtheirospermum japonicum]|uniref:S-protein homolog n=1 Tax=Phtheirospermum japonicum TaxID=374723 RepID=A0A830CEW0_9LAMI|nr:hypothetical protein PHJA_001429400 [Phtheirospermum japonicum]